MVKILRQQPIRAGSRLLSQILTAELVGQDGQSSSFLARQTAHLKDSAAQFKDTYLRTPTQQWLILGGLGLCVLLIIILVAQWTLEMARWKRRCRQQEEDEACKTHLKACQKDPNAIPDLESPTKLTTLDSSSSNKGVAPRPEPLLQPGDEVPIMKLPPRLLVRRTSSLRSSQSGSSPRSSSHRGRVGIVVRRRTPTSPNCTSPRSLSAMELTIDASVQAKDVTAVGWASHPHAYRAQGSFPSTLGSPSADAALSFVYSPKLEQQFGHLGPALYKDNTKAPDSPENLPLDVQDRTCTVMSTSSSAASSKRHRLARSSTISERSCVEAGSPKEQHGDVDAVKPPKSLLRYPTDTGLADFKLSTTVAEMQTGERDDSAQAEEEECMPDIYLSPPITSSQLLQRRASSGGSSSAPGLHTATSIRPQDMAQCPQISMGSHSPTPLTKPFGIRVLSPEQFLEDVRFDALLGAGGAGTVHRAQWRGRHVAVKVLHPSRQWSPSSIDGFRREVEVMAAVGTHPNVLRVLAACFTPPHMAVITELAERGSLAAALHEEGVRPRYGTLLQIAEDVAGAMAHCHAMRLVHRDLKTHNVLLTSDGRAVVADFGLAAAKNRTFLTLEPGALGTASVMAPEQFSGGRVDERCDVYAFGCLLWECITGRQPWDQCDNVMQIVMAVGCERRRPPIPAQCPAPLARLIRECWRHNSALRPGFVEVLERLQRMKKGDSIAEALQTSWL